MQVKDLRDRLSGIVNIPVDKLCLVKGKTVLDNDSETLASRGICTGTIFTYIEKVKPQPVEPIQPGDEVRDFLAEVATALNKPANSFDKIADELIAEEFETKDEIS
jgi:hypothetical protein